MSLSLCPLLNPLGVFKVNLVRVSGGVVLVTDSTYPRDLPIDHISNPIKDWVEDGVVEEVWDIYMENQIADQSDSPDEQREKNLIEVHTDGGFLIKLSVL